MKHAVLYTLLWLLGLLTACSGDDYHYPSVKLEFLTARSGSNGYLTSVMTDKGETYAVTQDDSGLRVGADSTLRILSQYELLPEGVRLYAVARAISPLPLKADAFKEGVVTDPVEFISIWKGWNYLNLLINVREPQGRHSFHFVEEQAEASAVQLRLYHKSESSVQAYGQRVYLSIPLAPYLNQCGEEGLTVSFTLQTYQGEVTHTFHFNQPS